MVVCPKDGRVVAVERQFEPENNQVCNVALTKALKHHPRVDCFILDRNCSFSVQAKTVPQFKGIKTWAIDKFHGRGHSKKCKCNPHNHRSIMKRLKGVNTSVCEQVWAWFRGYARTLNKMNAKRHVFLVLACARRHNEMMSKCDKSHLSPVMPSGKQRSGHYPCTRPNKSTKKAK